MTLVIPCQNTAATHCLFAMVKNVSELPFKMANSVLTLYLDGTKISEIILQTMCHTTHFLLFMVRLPDCNHAESLTNCLSQDYIHQSL